VPSRSSRRRLLLPLALAGCVACGSSEPRAPAAPADGDEVVTRKGRHGDAVAVLDRLAGAMRNDRAERLADVADPVHGLTFWGQPGACATPLFKVSRAEKEGRLSALAKARIGDVPPHFTDPDGYWRDVAETVRAGLRVVKIDAGRYELPPEEGLDRAPPWASLDTRDPALGPRELACLGDEVAAAGKAPAREYRYRFRAERGYSSVTVFLVEHAGELRAAHVLLVWHYDT